MCNSRYNSKTEKKDEKINNYLIEIHNDNYQRLSNLNKIITDFPSIGRNKRNCQ